MFTVLDEKKKLLDSKRPLSREVLTTLKKYFDVEFTYNSNAGVYRKTNVLISGSTHRPPEYFLVEDKMRELLDWYNEFKETMHPVKLAVGTHAS